MTGALRPPGLARSGRIGSKAELNASGAESGLWFLARTHAHPEAVAPAHRDSDVVTFALEDTHMEDLRAEAEELERKIAQAEQNEQNVDWTARTLTAAGDLDALDLDAKRRLLSALAVKVTVRTYTDEWGRLKDWTAELESYGAVVTDLAVTGAMCWEGRQQRDQNGKALYLASEVLEFLGAARAQREV